MFIFYNYIDMKLFKYISDCPFFLPAKYSLYQGVYVLNII